jgi:predicted sulfurtransferase
MKSKYVFKIKKKFGKCFRYKARLVAMKCDQEVNPQLNFATVVKPSIVRMLMALAQVHKMSIH